MRSPFSPTYLILFVLALSVILAIIQIGALSIAFEKLGLSQSSVFLLLFASLFGSAVNLPLFSIRSQSPPSDLLRAWGGLLRQPRLPFTGKTIIAINVGGGLIPIAFSLHLLTTQPVSFAQALLATLFVSAMAYGFSRPLPGLGIGMPILVGPVGAAVTATLLSPEHAAPLAYICGTLGVLIGADLLRLGSIRTMGVPIASIGGAGTFDGIFVTGIVAVLLA